MEAITPGAWSYDSFDPVNISIMTDKSLDAAISQEEERISKEILSGDSVVSESSLLQEESRAEDISLDELDIDAIETDSCDTSQIGMDAEAYVSVLQQTQGEFDLGDMIDIIEGL